MTMEVNDPPNYCEHFDEEGEQACGHAPTHRHRCDDGDDMFICDEHACDACVRIAPRTKDNPHRAEPIRCDRCKKTDGGPFGTLDVPGRAITVKTILCTRCCKEIGIQVPE